MATTSTGTESGTGRDNTAVLVGFTAVANLADGAAKVVLPLLAVDLTRSPALVAGVGLTLTLPWLLTALHVGVLVDRLDRRRLAMAGDVVRLAAVGALLGAAAGGVLSLPLVYAAGLAIGVGEVVTLTALSALVPAAVPRRRLERVNAWVAGAETVALEFAGPAVGGLLLGLGALTALGATGAAFAVGVVLLLFLRGRFRPEPRPRAPVRAEIREGLRHLWSHRLLRTMTLTISVLAACWSAWLALLPTYATHDLRLDESGYGLLIGAIGLGGLAGAVLAGPVNRLLGRRWALFADLAGTFLMMALPAVTGNAWAVGAAAFLGGMGGTLWTVNARTISASIVPGELYGRYSAASRLLGWGTLPVGAAVAGGVAQLAGERAAFAVFAGAVVLMVAPFLRSVTREALRETGMP
ncbi:MFS transporter [Bailinhaonella thermotolerans]|uniref:MFS transporter n=1 Tax=Bailinhaonella thermotolerans TaxID=1070861 RepID=A0A3A4BSD0_9ACTN|nr:MFS transporter [Bailinhaonella thermotolerans]RJL34226.1 MFS transporter [Bailinhaonella thermotolerans]